jgi:hypothetical protein
MTSTSPIVLLGGGGIGAGVGAGTSAADAPGARRVRRSTKSTHSRPT